MTAKKLAPIAFMVALFMAAPAFASQRRPEKAEARAENLAERLDDATRTLYRDARSKSRWSGVSHRRAVSSLKDLHREARAFERSVDRRGLDDVRTRRDFRDLKRAFHTAQGNLERLGLRKRARRAVYDDFARVEHLMNRMQVRIAKARRHDHDRYARDHRASRGDHDARRRDGRFDRVSTAGFGGRY